MDDPLRSRSLYERRPFHSCCDQCIWNGGHKDDVRCIIHWDFSSTIRGYYQEIGRAGRDGLTSKIILLYRDVDRHVHEFLLSVSG